MTAKTLNLITLAITCCLGLTMVNAATTRANRELCSPQSADLSQGGGFTTTCDWSRYQPGADVDAMITLNGHVWAKADCEFTGPDSVALVLGNKHADMKPLAAPGNRFDFVVKYKEFSGADDNQNIQIYLNTKKPSAEDKLVCRFTTW